MNINGSQTKCVIYLGTIFRRDSNEDVTKYIVDSGVNIPIIFKKMCLSIGIIESVYDNEIYPMIKDLLIKDKMFYREFENKTVFPNSPLENTLYFVDKDNQIFYVFDNKYKWFEKHTLLDKNDYICNDLLLRMYKNLICPDNTIEHVHNFSYCRIQKTYKQLEHNFICGSVTTKVIVPHLHPTNYGTITQYGKDSGYATSFNIYGYGGNLKSDYHLGNLHTKQLSILHFTEYFLCNNCIVYQIFHLDTNGPNVGSLSLHGRTYYGSSAFMRNILVYNTNTRTMYIMTIENFDASTDQTLIDVKNYILTRPPYNKTLYITKEEWNNPSM